MFNLLELGPKPLSSAFGCKIRISASSANKVLNPRLRSGHTRLQHASEPFTSGLDHELFTHIPSIVIVDDNQGH